MLSPDRPCCAIGDGVGRPVSGTLIERPSPGHRTALIQGDTMLKDMTRSRLIQAWFAALALVVAAALALGASVTVGTGAMLLVLCLVPPTIVLMLWPGVQPPTVAEVLHSVGGRG